MKSAIFALMFFALVGCGTGPCREHKTQQTSAASAQAELPMSKAKPTERVRVYKPDGSLQCGMGKAIAIDEMKKDLKGIEVFSSENKPDGLMHIQVCGSPTGRANVYEINHSDLEKARKAGFKEWTWD